MHFDIFTVMAASSTVVVVLGMTIFLFWSRDTKASWLAWWCVSFGVLAFGNVLVMARPMLPNAISSGIGASFLIGGFGLVWQAARQFEGKSPILWPVAAAIAGWLGIYFLGGIADNLPARIIVSSVPMAGGLYLAALEIWGGRAEHLPSRKGAFVVLAFLGSLFAARVPAAHFVPYPMGGLPVDGVWVAGFNGFIILSAIVLTAFLISMTMERVELGQRALARVDPLTGLFNRRALEEAFEGSVAANTAVMLFDLDRFKLVNDIYGHTAGDALLQRFTRICQENIRQVDFAARMGGEEFLIIVHDVEEHGAYQIAERIRISFADSLLATQRGEVGCTVSAGIEVSVDDGLGIDALVQRADAKLYKAKANGRNRICLKAEQSAA